MTHEELTAKAIKWLRQSGTGLPDELRDVTVDRLPKRHLSEAIVIDFSSDEDRGKIQIVLERDTGAPVGTTFILPKHR